MSVNPKHQPSRQPIIKNVTTAPLLYFDQAPTLGFSNNVGEIDLSARVSSLFGDGDIRQDMICVAHLRGSMEAFVSLRNAIDKMLKIGRYDAPHAADDYVDEEDPSPGAAFTARMHQHDA